MNIPKFVGHMAAGEFREAYETIRESNVLAAVCGYVCPAETQCEAACINRHYAESVPIRHLQRWVSRKAVEEGWAAAYRGPAAKTGKRVAVLGAGPAGISAAATLASLGHDVTLLDRGAALGGAAQATIPGERLPENVLYREIHDVLASSGVACHRQFVKLDGQYNLDSVLKEGHDAAVVALGLSQTVPLPVAIRPKSGVAGALEFLAAVKKGERVSGTVLVLGGGNTAIDAATSARKAGADEVYIVYRRSFAEMPAWPEERDAAIRAGIHFLILTAPAGYVMNGEGRLTGLRVVRTRLIEAGEDGRRTPQPIEGSEHVLPAVLVVEALGQQAGPELKAALPGVEFTSHGLIATVNGTLQTSRSCVFAAGDVVNGGTTVVRAVSEGARAARELDAWLRGA